MTSFSKPVRRVTENRLPWNYGPDSDRPLVVRLVHRGGKDLVEFRPKKTRQRVVMDVFDLYSFTLRTLATAAASARRLKKKGLL